MAHYAAERPIAGGNTGFERPIAGGNTGFGRPIAGGNTGFGRPIAGGNTGFGRPIAKGNTGFFLCRSQRPKWPRYANESLFNDVEFSMPGD